MGFPARLLGKFGAASSFTCSPAVSTCQGHLHGDCFYASLCESIDETERRIRQTTGYIDDAERLAAS